MNIAFGGTYQKHEWRKAVLLNMRPSPPLALLLVLFFGSHLVLALLSTDVPRALQSTLTMYVCALLIVPAIPLVGAEKEWRTDKAIRGPISGLATDTHLNIDYTHAKTSLAWSDLYRYKASSDLVLVYRAPLVFAAIPRTFFASPGDWTEFRAHVKQYVPGSSRGAVRGVLLFAALWIVSWLAITLVSG
jgi:hypothetical protein